MSRLLNPLLLAYPFLIILNINLLIVGENHFVHLAQSLLKGRFSLVELSPDLTDLSYFNGQYFLPFGPLPAIILTPFVWVFGANFQESLLKIPLTVLNFWLVYQIAKSLNLSKTASVWLAIFYIMGSVYLPLTLIPFSANLSQIVANTALLFTVYEFFHKKRWPLIGIATAAAFLSRPTALFASLFFIIDRKSVV